MRAFAISHGSTLRVRRPPLPAPLVTMKGAKRAPQPQRRTYMDNLDMPFYEYLNRVDSALEQYTGSPADSDMLAYIEAAYYDGVSPVQCAYEVGQHRVL